MTRDQERFTFVKIRKRCPSVETAGCEIVARSCCQCIGSTARERDAPQREAAGPPGTDDDVFPVGCPCRRSALRLVIGEPARFSACRRNDPVIAVRALLRQKEGDPRPFRSGTAGDGYTLREWNGWSTTPGCRGRFRVRCASAIQVVPRFFTGIRRAGHSIWQSLPLPATGESTASAGTIGRASMPRRFRNGSLQPSRNSYRRNDQRFGGTTRTWEDVNAGVGVGAPNRAPLQRRRQPSLVITPERFAAACGRG